MAFDLETLEFPLFIEAVKKTFVSSFGAVKLAELRPTISAPAALSFQNDLKALMDIYSASRPPELLNDHNFYLLFKRLINEKDNNDSPQAEDYLALKEYLFYLGRLRAYFVSKGEKATRVKAFTERIQPNETFARDIEATFEDDGEIKDSASAELARLRSGIRDVRRRIQGQLKNIFSKANADKYIQEQVVVLRHGRYTVPCKTNFSQYMEGIIHDRSTSGSTLYVEPSVCVPVNNELQESIMRERLEIARILAELARRLNDYLPELSRTVSAYTELVFRAELAAFFHKYDICFPEFTGKIRFNKVHHPLLFLGKGKASVPLDIRLEGAALMVVTGPNTGGKTASMKSLGLNHLIAMCGLPLFGVSADVDFFTEIRADIGDRQSLVMDLSTFSAHMTNIRDIITGIKGRALVLFDELGTGTDPREGAALAIAVLEYLRDKKAVVALTTHFSELKTYAFRRPDARLYAVDFDYETFAPRYNLLEGVAGSSDPVLIARRLGFPEEVTRQAESRAREMKSSLEAGLEELNLMKAEAEHKRRENELLLEKLASREAALSKKEGELSERLSRKELDLLEDTVALLQKGKRLAAQKDKSSPEEISQDLEAVTGRIGELKSKQKKIEGLTVGDSVYLERYGKSGKVLALEGKKAQIDLSGLKVWLPTMDLVGRKLKEEKGAKPVATVKRHSEGSRPELLLVGKRVEEALDIVDKYIDEAQLTGYEKVYIIHGRGSGQLRRAIQDFLRTCGRIKAYETASNEEGGNAVTVVEL